MKLIKVFKNSVYLVLLLPILVFSQEQSGYYVNWNVDHTERKVKPSIPISEQEAETVNCYLVKFNKKGRLSNVTYYFSGKKSNHGNYGAFQLLRVYKRDKVVEQYKASRNSLD